MAVLYQSQTNPQMVLCEPLVSDHCLTESRSRLFSEHSSFLEFGLSDGYDFFPSTDCKQYPPSDLLSLTEPSSFPATCVLDDLFLEGLDNCFDLDYISTPSNSSAAFSSSPSSPFTLSSPCLSSDDIPGVLSLDENEEQFYSPRDYLPYDTPPPVDSPSTHPNATFSPPPPSLSQTSTNLSSTSNSRKRFRSNTNSDARPKKSSRPSKKERKREQNKTAAIRYRQKKKDESEVLLKQQNELEDINEALHCKVDKLLTEINYLKGLWKEVSQARKCSSKIASSSTA